MRHLVVPLCAVVSLSACAGDDASPDRRPATTATTIEADVTTTAAVSEDEGIGGVEATLATLLITAEELGDPSFVDVGYTPTDESAPCGTGVDDDVALTTLVGTTIASPELGTTVQQELRGYGSVDDAADAFAAARVACGGASDVIAQVGGDEAILLSADDDRVVVMARVTDVIASFELTGASDGAVDPIEVAAFGVGKLLAFIEQGS